MHARVQGRAKAVHKRHAARARCNGSANARARCGAAHFAHRDPSRPVQAACIKVAYGPGRNATPRSWASLTTMLALAWALTHPSITSVLIGARPAQVDQTLSAEALGMSAKLMAELSSCEERRIFLRDLRASAVKV